MLALALSALLILAGVNTLRTIGEQTAAKRLEGATLALLSIGALVLLARAG